MDKTIWGHESTSCPCVYVHHQSFMEKEKASWLRFSSEVINHTLCQLRPKRELPGESEELQVHFELWRVTEETVKAAQLSFLYSCLVWPRSRRHFYATTQRTRLTATTEPATRIWFPGGTEALSSRPSLCVWEGLLHTGVNECSCIHSFIHLLTSHPSL